MIQHLDPWPFVVAAYAVTLGGTGVLALVSWLRMRRAERPRGGPVARNFEE